MNANMLDQTIGQMLSVFFQTLASPIRIEILLALGSGEACVCHLEACLGYRQAHISQHLMAMRQAGLLESRKDGRFVYYRLTSEAVLSVMYQAAGIAGVKLPDPGLPAQAVVCDCPPCQEARSVVRLEEIA